MERHSSSLAFYDQNQKLLRLTLSSDDKYRLWVSLSEVHPDLIKAVLLYEDRWFYFHPGINPYALGRAGYETYFQKTRRLGGSTIPMQLARIIHGLSSKTLAGKCKQIGLALWLELRYSKNEILEAYLNYAPYGGNIEGVAAASLIYFAKNPRQLTLNEALTLAVIPQSPGIRTQDNKRLAGAREILIKKWEALYAINEEEKTFLQTAPEFKRPKDLPFRAPHFTDLVWRLSSSSRKKTVETTLDPDLQTLLEDRIRGYLSQNNLYGIRNAAGLLLDYTTMEVKGFVGSADFFNDEIEGQVNGVMAKRSPGSALKPFIYALGIEQGLIHSQTLMKDTPASFGAYAPDNFDGHFSGPLSAQDALIRSRNIPAVYIASKLSDPGIYGLLKNAGIANLRSETYYGLSLVLGGAEVSMFELSGLYAALPNKGRLKPIKLLKNPKKDTGTALLSEQAVFIVLKMLENNPRPDYPKRYSWIKNDLAVYWKSGTSYGFRDAWAVGIFGPYVLAVWIGNFDGSGNPAFIGTKAAAPLFFSIIDAIRAQKPGLREPIIMPPNVKEIRVCALSGQLPNPFCPHTKPAWFIPGKSPIDSCQIHREVRIDPRTGLRLCNRTDQNVKTEVYEFWPSDIMRIFNAAGIPRRLPPPFAAECGPDMDRFDHKPPQIVSPREGLDYSLRPNDHGKQTISLEAVLDAGARKIFWFLDDRFLGSAERGKSLDWQAQPGRYILRAVDDLGGATSRLIEVQMEN
ncbi:MAG: penicillin-binding protein 1C [Desulfobacteraceae bacterium]|nr:MAG: penicillin-binding protein 1C [Desulfobacteraceae bacterium]